MKILNINCIYYKRGVCDLPEVQKLLKLFRPTCLKLDDNECIFVKQHPKPPAPPAPPPKRVISEDVRIRPLTEGRVRGGMNNAMKKIYSRPTHPPPSPKKLSNKKEILKKVERREFVLRCVAVDICPKCGYILRSETDHIKVCTNCNLTFDAI